MTSAKKAEDVDATARRIIDYMLDRGPVAPSSELTALVRQELGDFGKRIEAAE